MRFHANPRARYAFSYVEVTMAAALTLVVAGSVYGLANAGAAALYAGSVQSDLDASVRQAVEAMIPEIGGSGAGTFTPVPPSGLPGASTLTFQKNLGWSGGSILWGPPITYRFEYDPGEVNDGLDNNGNGVADEGVLVRVEGARRRILCKWVREGGVQFALSGDDLTIRIEAIRRDRNRRTQASSQETTFHVPD